MPLEQTCLITNRLGLHARAAARFVNTANQFKSEIRVVRTDSWASADGKSILSVIFLAAPRGTQLLLIADGPDEQAALYSLVELVRNGFGEDTDVF